jgi:hypothetical protein
MHIRTKKVLKFIEVLLPVTLKVIEEMFKIYNSYDEKQPNYMLKQTLLNGKGGVTSLLQLKRMLCKF